MNKALHLAQMAYEQLENNPAAADTLGWVYYKRNMLTRAGWLLSQAYESAPDNPMVNFHLGMLYKAEENREEAIERLKRALDLGLPEIYHLQAVESLEGLV